MSRRKNSPTKVVKTICKALDVKLHISSKVLCCTHIDLLGGRVQYSIYFPNEDKPSTFMVEHSGISFFISRGITEDIYVPIIEKAIKQLESFTYKP